MLTRVFGCFSCLRPVRIQVIPQPSVYTDKRPSTWQHVVDVIKSDANLPCTHLPHHLTGTDKTWPQELQFYPFFVSHQKTETAQLLRKTYPAEKRLIEFAHWLDAVAETHPEHKIKATELAISLMLSLLAIGIAYSKVFKVLFT